MQMLGGKRDQSWGQPSQPQQHESHYPSNNEPNNSQYNEPPMDFDDDIPFAPIGLQYPALLLCI